MKKYFFILIALNCTAHITKGQLLFNEKSNDYSLNHMYAKGNIFGGGVSFFDFNKDGKDDLSFASGRGDSLQFYASTGDGFQNLGALGINETQESKQLLWVDFDNDDDYDLYVTNYNGRSRLWENIGDLNFKNITAQAGLRSKNMPTFGASWGDFDRDGFLDLFVPNYSTPAHYSSQKRNYLYRNQGNGTFTEIAESQGVLLAGDYNYYFSSAFLDLNQNRWPDLYLIQDFGGNTGTTGNILFWNDSGQYRHATNCGSIEEERMSAMSIAAGDFNRTGNLDIYVTNVNDSYSKLHVNSGDSTFTEYAKPLGIEYNDAGFGWGAQFFDFDNDMWEDLGVVGATLSKTNTPQIDRLYRNINGNSFEPLNEMSIDFSDSAWSIGLAYGDYNGDGLLDFSISTSVKDSVLFYENAISNNNHHFSCQLNGIVSNKDGIGSWVEVYTIEGKQVRYTTCGLGFLSQNTSKIHFGLGQFTNIDSVKVKWASGWIDTYYDVLTDQFMNITEGETADFRFDLTASNPELNDNVSEITLTAPNYESYLWNTDQTKNNLTVIKSGTYACSVLDASGKKGLSNPSIILDNTTPSKENSTLEVLNTTQRNASIHPNPSSGLFNVSTENLKSISVYNISGKEVWTGQQSSFNLTNHANGVYVVKVKNNSETTSMKIVKK